MQYHVLTKRRNQPMLPTKKSHVSVVGACKGDMPEGVVERGTQRETLSLCWKERERKEGWVMKGKKDICFMFQQSLYDTLLA